MKRPRSSRQRYQSFVRDYRQRRLDEITQGEKPATDAPPEATRRKRREYLREYLRWLKPHRYAVCALFALALITAGLQMVEPLFMRFIVDRVLLNPRLDRMARLRLVNSAVARSFSCWSLLRTW
jgi:ATP-binding cassette subfamily B protein/subfamily B ATP-binding cassette protein MsbA